MIVNLGFWRTVNLVGSTFSVSISFRSVLQSLVASTDGDGLDDTIWSKWCDNAFRKAPIKERPTEKPSHERNGTLFIIETVQRLNLATK